MRLPHFNFYPWDWDNDERMRMLSLEEQGAVLRILIAMWKWAAKHDTVDLPNDDRFLASQIGVSADHWSTLRPALIDSEWAVFHLDPETNTIYSSKLREVYADAIRLTTVRQENGAKGGRQRKKKPTENLPVSESLPDRLATANRPEINSQISNLKNQEREIAHARGWNPALPPEIVDWLERLSARPNQAPILLSDEDQLLKWHVMGMEWPVMIRAFDHVLQGNLPFRYALAMIQRWVQDGKHTLAQVVATERPAHPSTTGPPRAAPRAVEDLPNLDRRRRELGLATGGDPG